MIVRGTTPYHNFIIPIEPSQIKKLIITYFQNGVNILEKTGDDIDLKSYEDFLVDCGIERKDISEEEKGGSMATVYLTEKETFLFNFYLTAKKNIVMIQLKLKDEDGRIYASKPIKERVYGVFNEELIEDE